MISDEFNLSGSGVGRSRVLLAPMEGVVDYVMRDLLTEIGGLDFCATEFIRVTSLLNPASVFHKYCPELRLNKGRTRSGTPVFIQLLGGQAGPMAENAARAAELGAPGIDINFGCPAKTVNRHDGGSVILKWPERVFEIASSIRRAVPREIPVTVKIRLGFEDTELFLDNVHAAGEAGAHWLTIHARTKVDGYKPPAHWEFLARACEISKIPIIGNGDIWSLDDFRRCREVSGCQHFMLGRGLIARPDLARQIKSQIDNDVDELAGASALPWREILQYIERFNSMSFEFRHEHYAVSRFKQWTRLLGRNYPEAADLFQKFKRVKNLEEICFFD